MLMEIKTILERSHRKHNIIWFKESGEFIYLQIEKSRRHANYTIA